MCRRPAQKGAGRRSTRALPGRLLNQDPSQDRSRRLSDRLRQAEVLRKSPLQSAGTNRTNDRQDQALQTYRTTLREDGNKLCLIPRTRLRIHLNQIRPHGLARRPNQRITADSALQPFVTQFVTRLPCPKPLPYLDKCARERY